MAASELTESRINSIVSEKNAISKPRSSAAFITSAISFTLVNLPYPSAYPTLAFAINVPPDTQFPEMVKPLPNYRLIPTQRRLECQLDWPWIPQSKLTKRAWSEPGVAKPPSRTVSQSFSVFPTPG